MAEASDDLKWPEVYSRISALLRSRSRINALYIAGEYLLLAVSIGGAVWSLEAWRAEKLSTVAFVPLAALAICFIGAIQHRLAGLGHEASHYALFRKPLINDMVSDLLLMMPTAAITQQFRTTHLEHHRHINDPVRDPDARRLGNGLPGAFPMAKRRYVMRYVLGCLWLPDLIRYILHQGLNAGIFAPMERPLKNPYPLWVAGAMLALFWAALFTATAFTGTFTPLILFWIVPLLTTFPFLMQLREIAHHSNAPDGGDLTNSRIFLVHPLLRWSVFPYGQEYHLTHHLFGRLPHYHAAEAHSILLRYPPYRENAVVCTGYFLGGSNGVSVLDVVSRPRRTSGLPGLRAGHPEVAREQPTHHAVPA